MLTVQDLPPSERRRFRSGRPSLDFSHTGGEGAYAVFELLRGPADLERWLGLLVGAPVRADPDGAEVEEARELRNAIGRAARSVAAGGAPAPDDVAIINAAAAHPPVVPHLDVNTRVPGSGSSPREDGTGRIGDGRGKAGGPSGGRDVGGAPRAAAVEWLPATVRQALSTLARDAIDLLGGPLAGRIRMCAAEDCGLLFVDTSRPGRRRWCSMERCGNLAKTRRYRSRRSSG